jgi:hypothetical protein
MPPQNITLRLGQVKRNPRRVPRLSTDFLLNERTVPKGQLREVCRRKPVLVNSAEILALAVPPSSIMTGLRLTLNAADGQTSSASLQGHI